MKSAKDWSETIPGYFEGDHRWELAKWIATIQADAVESCALRSIELGGVGTCESLAYELRKLKPEAG